MLYVDGGCADNLPASKLNYETRKPVRWRIGMASGQPLGIAGLWLAWNDVDGESLSFTMLTVNAGEHLLMKRFHKPGDEKRSILSACSSTEEVKCKPCATRTYA